jgi:hypothetical protein
VDSFLETKDPYMLASRLEMAILSNDKYFEEPLAVVRENDLLGRSSAFMDGFVQLLKFGTTPRPYVTTQMGRTMVLIWILGLPFAITNQHAKHIFEALILVFLVTYGFIGLTMADIELHDPLGNDPNDLEGARYTKIVIQAIEDYFTNGIVDGEEEAGGIKKAPSIRGRLNGSYGSLSESNRSILSISPTQFESGDEAV